ncbi:MAG: iron-sulfur cluster repair di-iron protein [Bacteroidales bacterium]|nr:iron-sulfur cluster repair di-iron protein [Bacteroidales bacterium]
MELNAHTKVGDIVKTNFRTARIFEEHGIDFCCGGSISLEESCSKSDVDIHVLLSELEEMVAVSDPDSGYINGLELDELCDYIEKQHHTYIREHTPFIQQKLQKLCDVHGEHHPELFEVKKLFDGAAENLSTHMQKEEQVLFPYIRQMVKQKKGEDGTRITTGGILQPISQMEEEHQVEGDRFKEISSLTSTYTTPPDGCNTYRITYQELNEFEMDLHRHIHLENNILFVKAQQLEEELIDH